MSHGCVCSTRGGVLRADIAHLFVSRVFAAPHDTVSEISYTLRPTPHPPHPTPCTLHPAPLQFARLCLSCFCCPSWHCGWKFLHPTSCTLHSTPYILHPTSCTLPHPTPYTLHPTPYILPPLPNPTFYALHPAPYYTLHPTPYTLYPKSLRFACLRQWCLCCPSKHCMKNSCTLHPTTYTLHPASCTLLHPTPCPLPPYDLLVLSSLEVLLLLTTLWVCERTRPSHPPPSLSLCIYVQCVFIHIAVSFRDKTTAKIRILRQYICFVDNCFVSTTKNSMKCVVNWIPLSIRVRSRNTQPRLKAMHMFCQ